MIDLRIKRLFFDRGKIVRAVDAAKRKSLARGGAFIRTTARRSIRKRKSAAPPGSPPHSHTGLLRRFILFGYDRLRESVVVGPARIHRATDAPHTLEFGGRTRIVRRGGKRRVVRIKARPYMVPALEKARGKLDDMWAGSVRA